VNNNLLSIAVTFNVENTIGCHIPEVHIFVGKLAERRLFWRQKESIVQEEVRCLDSDVS
jgi:hypothetical protein